MSPSLRRWVVPLGVAAAVLGLGAGATALRRTADPALAPRTAAQLLVDLQNARLDGLSGTIVQRADLGLPALPLGEDGTGSAELGALISGSHTLRVWYAGPDKVRVAVLRKLGETDVIRNGRDVWIWSSDEQRATHHTLRDGLGSLPPARMLPMTPQEAADRVLSALDPTTVVSTAGTDRVAGRPVYELVLAPRDGASLVSQVRLAIDAEQRVPLRVRVNAKGATSPVVEIGFTQVSFVRPGDEHFTFTAPPGTRVEEGEGTPRGDHGSPWGKAPLERSPLGKAHREKSPEGGPAATRPASTVVGSGWTAVFVARIPAGTTESGIAAFLGTLPRVSGPWGSGRVLRSRLVTALLTDDGRLLVGAVTPERLYAAAVDPAAALK